MNIRNIQMLKIKQGSHQADKKHATGFQDLMAKPLGHTDTAHRDLPSPLHLQQSANKWEEILLSDQQEDSFPKEDSAEETEQDLSMLSASVYYPLQMPTISRDVYPMVTQKKADIEIVELLQNLGGDMMIMNDAGSIKTTLYCTDRFPESSVFQDMEITIEEFTSAPKLFNITLKGSPQAIEVASIHLEAFMKLFQERKFGFSINRIDTEISTAKSLFSRKEPINPESDDQEGNTRQ
jgi:hypothetical protein